MTDRASWLAHDDRSPGDVVGDVSITIDAPASAVYAYLADFTRHPEWSRNLYRVTKVSDGPTVVGTTFRTSEGAPPVGRLKQLKMMFFVVVGIILGAKPYSEAELVALEPNRRIAWKARFPRRGGTFNQAYWWVELEEQGGATHVTQRFRYSPQTWAARRMVGTAATIETGCAANLASLKARLERG
jgi:uncharacterized membrane protein